MSRIVRWRAWDDFTGSGNMVDRKASWEPSLSNWIPPDPVDLLPPGSPDPSGWAAQDNWLGAFTLSDGRVSFWSGSLAFLPGASLIYYSKSTIRKLLENQDEETLFQIIAAGMTKKMNYTSPFVSMKVEDVEFGAPIHEPPYLVATGNAALGGDFILHGSVDVQEFEANEDDMALSLYTNGLLVIKDVRAHGHIDTHGDHAFENGNFFASRTMVEMYYISSDNNLPPALAPMVSVTPSEEFSLIFPDHYVWVGERVSALLYDNPILDEVGWSLHNGVLTLKGGFGPSSELIGISGPPPPDFPGSVPIPGKAYMVQAAPENFGDWESYDTTQIDFNPLFEAVPHTNGNITWERYRFTMWPGFGLTQTGWGSSTPDGGSSTCSISRFELEVDVTYGGGGWVVGSIPAGSGGGSHAEYAGFTVLLSMLSALNMLPK